MKANHGAPGHQYLSSMQCAAVATLSDAVTELAEPNKVPPQLNALSPSLYCMRTVHGHEYGTALLPLTIRMRAS